MYYYLSAIPWSAHYIEAILGSINHFDTVFNIFKTYLCKAVSIVFCRNIHNVHQDIRWNSSTVIHNFQFQNCAVYRGVNADTATGGVGGEAMKNRVLYQRLKKNLGTAAERQVSCTFK